MSAVYPPTEHNVRAVSPDGMALVQNKSHEMQMRFSGVASDESGGKKVSKEMQRERQKVEKYRADMTETTEAMIGASPADDLQSSIEIVPVRSMWNKDKERKEFNDFLRFKRKYENAYIPEVKEEMKNKILKRFGTLVPEVLATRLGIEMQADPRLSVKTRRGVIKTTVELQRQYSASRSAVPFEGAKR